MLPIINYLQLLGFRMIILLNHAVESNLNRTKVIIRIILSHNSTFNLHSIIFKKQLSIMSKIIVLWVRINPRPTEINHKDMIHSTIQLQLFTQVILMKTYSRTSQSSENSVQCLFTAELNSHTKINCHRSTIQFNPQ